MDLIKIKDFLFRNGIWMALIVSSLYLLFFQNDVIFAGLYIIFGEGLALGLSSLSVKVYTELDFVKEFSHTTDLGKLSHAVVLSAIFLGVHFVVGACMYGIFLAAK